MTDNIPALVVNLRRYYQTCAPSMRHLYKTGPQLYYNYDYTVFGGSRFSPPDITTHINIEQIFTDRKQTKAVQFHV